MHHALATVQENAELRQQQAAAEEKSQKADMRQQADQHKQVTRGCGSIACTTCDVRACVLQSPGSMHGCKCSVETFSRLFPCLYGITDSDQHYEPYQ